MVVPAITITFPSPSPVPVLLLPHKSLFAAAEPPRRRRCCMPCELDSSRGLQDGSLETAAPRRALAGAHMKNSGTPTTKTNGKGLGQLKGIYTRPGAVMFVHELLLLRDWICS